MKKKIKRTTPEPLRIIKQLSSNIAEKKTKNKKLNFKKKKTSTLKKEKKQSILRRTY